MKARRQILTFIRGLALGVAVLCLLQGAVFSQQKKNEIRILRIDTTSYPTIRVHVRAICNGIPNVTILPVQLDVRENDRVFTFQLQCPVETVPVSVALCLDRSGSVAGTTIYRIQQGALEFIDLMGSHPGGVDEAAIISFADEVTVDQRMTSNKPALVSAVYNLYPLGWTRLWEGLIKAINEVAATGLHPRKAVVLLSDGYNTRGSATREEAIAAAQQAGVPVYVIGITYGDEGPEAQGLVEVAKKTGGKFFPIDEPDQIIQAYNAVMSYISDGLNDCIASYTTSCADGSLRKVTVTATTCGVTVTKSLTYRAPADSTLPSFTIWAGEADVFGGNRARLPIMISSGTPGATVTELSFAVPLPPLVSLRGVETAGHFAEGFSLDSSRSRDSLFFRFRGSKPLTGADTLMVLVYDTDEISSDTTLTFHVWRFSKSVDSCQVSRVDSGKVRLRVRPALNVYCSDTVRVNWNEATGKYSPDTLAITATIRNHGPATAQNITAGIVDVPYGLKLLTPALAQVSPSTLSSGESGTAVFRFAVSPVDSSRDWTICIRVRGDSTQVSTCCTVIKVEKARTHLALDCSTASAVRWDSSASVYVPNPFPVTAVIRNHSDLDVGNVLAWIHVPPGFVIDGQTPMQQQVQPVRISRDDSGVVRWMIRALERPTDDTVRFCIKAASGKDTTVCCLKLFVTKAPVRLAMACDGPPSFSFDVEGDSLLPSRFEVAVRVENLSEQPMSNTRLTIDVPSGYDLQSGEVRTKRPQGGLMMPGDTAVFRWRLRGTRDAPDFSTLCVTLRADNSVEAYCCSDLLVVRVNAKPDLACSLATVDTVRFVDSVYVPDPVTVRVRIKNTGNATARRVFAVLHQGADISIEAGDQAQKLVADSLAPGQEITAQFRLHVLPRNQDRTDTIRVSVYAENGGASSCRVVVFIEKTLKLELLAQCSSPDSLRFDPGSGNYQPNPFPVGLIVRNEGDATARNVTAEFLSSAGIVLAVGESAVKPLQPDSILPGGTAQVTFSARALPRSAPALDSIRIRVSSVGGGELVQTMCLTATYIPPIVSGNVLILCRFLDTLRVVDGAYRPGVVILEAVVQNTGGADLRNVPVMLAIQNGLALSNDSAGRSIPLLRAGGSIVLRWKLAPLVASAGGKASVCIAAPGFAAPCCAELDLPFIPGDRSACSAPDTVSVDSFTGEYGTFPVRAWIVDLPPGRTDTLNGFILLPAGLELANGYQPVMKRLPGESDTLEWLVVVTERADTGRIVEIRTVIVRAGKAPLECRRTVFIPPAGRISAFLSCDVPDSILVRKGGKEIIPATATVSTTVRNTGDYPLVNLFARLVLPDGVSFASGSVPTQVVASLSPGATWSPSWNVAFSPVNADRLEWTVVAGADNLDENYCRDSTRVVVEPMVVRFRIPTGNLAWEANDVEIPVYFEDPDGVEVRSFRLVVGFDPGVADVKDIRQDGSLTAAWAPLQVSGAGTGEVRVSGAGPNPLDGAGVVFRMLVAGKTAGPFDIARTVFRIVEAEAGKDVTVETADGDLTVSGRCVAPLNSSGATLEQNSPNPFNPVTRIRFSVPGETRAVLEIIDVLGNRRARVFDRNVAAGVYTVTWNAAGLPSGLYFYRLVTNETILVRKMVVAK